MTSSSLGHEVVVYDSKLRRGKLNSTLTLQLCVIYRTLIKVEINTGHLIVQFPYTQKQKGVVYLQLHLHFMQQWEIIYQVCSLIS